MAAGGGAPPEETGPNGLEDRTSFSTTLRRIALTDRNKISIGDAVQAFGDGGLAATLTLLGLVNMLPLPPGSSTVLGLPLLLVSWQLARGRTAIRLPARISAGSVSARHFRAVLKRLGGSLAAVERCMRPRLTLLVEGLAQRVIGVICVGLAAILMLPIWGGNLVPAAIVTLFGMGMMRRDGLVVLVAWAGVIALGVAAWMLFDLIRQQGGALWDRLAVIFGGA